MIIEILRKRRSIRQFKNRPLENHQIELLTEALLRSPASRSFNSWEFIFVQDKKKLLELSQCKQHGSTLIKGAALAIVVLGDTTKTDVWIEDCSIASIIIQLTAEDLGLGSCWVQVRNRKYNENQTSEDHVKKSLDIPEDMAVESIIAIGWPDEVKEGHDRSTLQYDKIHEEKYVISDQ